MSKEKRDQMKKKHAGGKKNDMQLLINKNLFVVLYFQSIFFESYFLE
jgi:hypothetical protein